jgi:hypothetical protein
MDEERPAIPSQVKLRLRQESGFGCCRCGHPFIAYHHIIPWAEDQHYRPEDMMVLCDNCHRLCTVEALQESQQRALKARPKNIVDQMIHGQLFINSNRLIVNIAGGQAINTPRLLTLSGEVVLAARLSETDGRVLLSAKIHDHEGKKIAELLDNEWSMVPADVWDFECYPRHAKIRKDRADISFVVDVRTDDQVSLQGKWYHNGMELKFTQSDAQIGANGINLSGNIFENCGGMIEVR